MKKPSAIVAILFCFLVLPNCLHSPVKRGMLDANTYYSTHSPNIQITVNPDFSYRSGKKGQFKHQFINSKDQKYIYVHHFKRMTNETQVDYYHNPMNWIFNKFQNAVEIDRGTTLILDKKWYYRDCLMPLASGGCLLIRDLALFTEKHDRLKILYEKKLPGFKCRDWREYSHLSGRQKRLVRRFVANFSNDVEISQFVTPQ